MNPIIKVFKSRSRWMALVDLGPGATSNFQAGELDDYPDACTLIEVSEDDARRLSNLFAQAADEIRVEREGKG